MREPFCAMEKFGKSGKQCQKERVKSFEISLKLSEIKHLNGRFGSFWTSLDLMRIGDFLQNFYAHFDRIKKISSEETITRASYARCVGLLVTTECYVALLHKVSCKGLVLPPSMGQERLKKFDFGKKRFLKKFS